MWIVAREPVERGRRLRHGAVVTREQVLERRGVARDLAPDAPGLLRARGTDAHLPFEKVPVLVHQEEQRAVESQRLAGGDASQHEMQQPVEVEHALHQLGDLAQPRELIDFLRLVGHVERELEHLLHLAVLVEHGRGGMVVLAQGAVGTGQDDFRLAVDGGGEALLRRAGEALRVAPAIDFVAAAADDRRAPAEPVADRAVGPKDPVVPADERQAGADQVHDVLELLLLAEDFFAGAAPVGDVLEQQQHAAAFGDLGRGDVHVEITLRLVRGLDAQVRAEERLALRGGAVDGRLQAALLEERGRQEPADVHAVQLFRGAAEEAAEAWVREKDAHLRIEHAQARRHRLEDAAVQVEEQARLLEELRVGDGLRELVGERLHRHHVAVVEGVDLALLDVDDAERLAVQPDRHGQFGEELGLARERDDVSRVLADVVGEDGLPVAGDPADDADAEFLPVAFDALRP